MGPWRDISTVGDRRALRSVYTSAIKKTVTPLHAVHTRRAKRFVRAENVAFIARDIASRECANAPSADRSGIAKSAMK